MDNNCVHYGLKLLFKHICYSSINTYIYDWHYIFLSKYDFMQIKYSFFCNLKIFRFLSVSSQAIFLYFYFNRIMCVERHDAMRKIWEFIFFPLFKRTKIIRMSVRHVPLQSKIILLQNRIKVCRLQTS